MTNINSLKWNGYLKLQTQFQFSTVQIVNQKLLATTDQQPKRIEIANLKLRSSIYFDNVFNCGNEMPISFVGSGQLFVIGGAQRGINYCEANAEVATFKNRQNGFEPVYLNDSYFPNNELDSNLLLSVEFSL